jgi:ABC-type polysaccharide/polyol phosphate export permease
MSRASFRSVTLAVAWRTLHNMFHNPAILLPSIIFPLFFFTAFAGGLSRVEDVPGFDFSCGYTAFQYVFVLLQSAAFGGVFTGFSAARDYESQFARRMMLAAPDRRSLIAGYAIAAMVRALVTWTIITTVALVTGMQVGGSAVDLFGLYGLALIVNVAATLFAVGIAMRFRTLQAGPLMQTPTFLILFLAPVYVPLDALQGWISTVASYNPATALLEAGRGFIAGDPTGVLLAFAVAVGLVGGFALWAIRGLRSAEQAG